MITTGNTYLNQKVNMNGTILENFIIIIVLRTLEKAGDIKTLSSVCPSVCHKIFYLAHIIRSVNDRALIFGMHDPCDKPFPLAPLTLTFDLKV